MILLFLLSSAQAASENDAIVITASRVPQEQSETAASTSVIDSQRIERLGDPLAPALIRLTPSASVESGGPAGSLAQVRIRGAEANHTLLFIDGIRANDPAAGGIARFELLNADILSRLEVVRGPQSALWGSEAIGGVIAVSGTAPTVSARSAAVEGGSFGFARARATAALAGDQGALAAAVGWQGASGIDSFGIDGEKDGYRNLAARFRATLAPLPDAEVGASGFVLSGRSDFDGFDPATFRRSDTLDSTRNRLTAGRLWISAGEEESGLSGMLATSLLSSTNRNFIGGDPINRTSGRRWTAGGQLQYRFSTGRIAHTTILAIDHDREKFRASDTIYFGATGQERRRSHDAATGEWRAEAGGIVAHLAVRHDRFSAFKNSTNARASILIPLGGGVSLAGAYSEGIAQPTFFDLFGFFPGSFEGNPSLTPERSRGFEGSIRYSTDRFAAAVTFYRQRLSDEIVDVFDPATFVSTSINREEKSRRQGIEAEFGWSPGRAFRLSINYAYLDASEPGASGAGLLREVRRPRHSGALALDGESGRFTYGGSLAYVGARSDTNFDIFPARRVRLAPYWLAGARIAYRLQPGIALFARGTNLLGEEYQDVFGYRTEGRGIFAGVTVGGD